MLIPLLIVGCGDAIERPNVVLVTIDTLRADYVSAYGFALETTPELDSLGRRGAVFMRAIAGRRARWSAAASSS